MRRAALRLEEQEQAAERREQDLVGRERAVAKARQEAAAQVRESEARMGDAERLRSEAADAQRSLSLRAAEADETERRLEERARAVRQRERGVEEREASAVRRVEAAAAGEARAQEADRRLKEEASGRARAEAAAEGMRAKETELGERLSRAARERQRLESALGDSERRLGEAQIVLSGQRERLARKEAEVTALRSTQKAYGTPLGELPLEPPAPGGTLGESGAEQAMNERLRRDVLDTARRKARRALETAGTLSAQKGGRSETSAPLTAGSGDAGAGGLTPGSASAKQRLEDRFSSVKDAQGPSLAAALKADQQKLTRARGLTKGLGVPAPGMEELGQRLAALAQEAQRAGGAQDEARVAQSLARWELDLAKELSDVTSGQSLA